MIHVSIEDIIQFVLKYRRGKAFKDYTEEQIRNDIVRSVDTMSIIVDTYEQNNILGVATGYALWSKRVIHVKNILTISNSSLRRIFKRFMEIYPGWKLQGERNSKIKHYNHIEKFYGRLCNQNN